MSDATRRFLVTGKVQGVFFRHSTRLEAARLSLRGFARNLPDGSVEVVARGSPPALDELARWLRTGPSGARVDALRDAPLDDADEAPEGFEVL